MHNDWDRADAQMCNFLNIAIADTTDNGAAMLRAAKRDLDKAVVNHDLLEQMRMERMVSVIVTIQAERSHAATPCENCGKARSEHKSITWRKPFGMDTVIGGPPEPVQTLAVLCPTVVFKERGA